MLHSYKAQNRLQFVDFQFPREKDVQINDKDQNVERLSQRYNVQELIKMI